MTTQSANRCLGIRHPAWLIFGLFPSCLSGFFALVFHRPKLALVPLFGFCALDLLRPTPRETVTWSCVIGARAYINYYATNDTFLTGDWQSDRDSKPALPLIPDYGYHWDGTNFSKGLVRPYLLLLFPVDTYEIFSYCDEKLRLFGPDATRPCNETQNPPEEAIRVPSRRRRESEQLNARC